jgi:hypothetical protein
MHNASRVLNVGMRDQLVIGIDEYKGKWGLDVRFYFTTLENQLRPTTRGARIPLQFAKIVAQTVLEVLEDAGKTTTTPIRSRTKKATTTRKGAKK